ncbi:hypothetical protein APT65_00015 [Trabzonvirus APT65]|uniref:Peptidase S74 domain-containing protein n=1 Tax=Aeromonas phage APT65 TaxID=2982914 RepID=A0A9E8K2G1_9CAUD|nr:hypothetical protein APT65_00015 [Aeromonas phage APT65]
MSFFSNDVRVSDTATPNNFTVANYTGPNVSQYGWTSADQGNYNQLIQYVDECRRISEHVDEVAAYIDSVMIDVQNIETIYLATKDVYDQTVLIKTDFDLKYSDFIVKYEDFTPKYDDFLIKYADFLVKYSEVITYRDQAAASAVLSAGSAALSENYYNLTYTIYLDLKEGQVYRGTWNPNTNAYPNAHGTNSVWDVVLNSGQTSYDFDGKTWRSGDRLLYVLASTEYQQLATGSGVLSVNGKVGAVTLTYTDVDAVPTTRTINSKPLSSNVVLTYTDVGAAPAGFGLGGTMNSTLLSGASCNIATETGWYNVFSGTTDTPFTTGPSGSALQVMKWGSSSIYQVFYSYTSDRIFTRRMNSGVWQPWFEIYSTSRKPTATDILSSNGKTLQYLTDKVNQIYDVKDYGAVGDGVTDDTTAVQNALDAIPSGSILSFTKGTYKINIVNINKPVKFVGHAKIIVRSFRIKTSNFISELTGEIVAPDYNSTCRAFQCMAHLDAADYENIQILGANFSGYFYSTDIRGRDYSATASDPTNRVVKNVLIQGCTSKAPVGQNAGHFQHTGLTNVKCIGNSTYGGQNATSYNFINGNGDILVVGNYDENNSYGSLEIENNVISSGVVSGNMFGHDLWIDDTSNIHVVGNNTKRVIRVTSQHNDVQNVSIVANRCAAVSVTTFGVSPIGVSRNITVNGNHVYNDLNSHCVFADNTVYSISVEGNQLYIAPGGTGNVVGLVRHSNADHKVINNFCNGGKLLFSSTGGSVIEYGNIGVGSGSTAGSGTMYANYGNLVYHQGFKPTPSEIGTMTTSEINSALNSKLSLSGGTMTGPITSQTAKSSIVVNGQASISYQDAGQTVFHTLAYGNAFAIAKNTNGDTNIWTITPGGQTQQAGPNYNISGTITQSPDLTKWVSIESSNGADPYLASRGLGEANNTVAMRFGSSITVEKSTNFNKGVYNLYSISRNWNSYGLANYRAEEITASSGALRAALSYPFKINGVYAVDTYLGTYANGSSAAELTHVLGSTDGGSFNRLWMFGLNGSLVYKTDAAGTTGTISSISPMTAPSFTPTSDVNIKSDLIKIENCLDVISNFTPYNYSKRGSEGREDGLIAQDVQLTLPDSVKVVSTDESFYGVPEVLGVNYSSITAVNSGAINELHKLVKILSSKIESLESEIVTLRANQS